MSHTKNHLTCLREIACGCFRGSFSPTAERERFSFTPCFSWVLVNNVNAGKPFKRFPLRAQCEATQLKQGVNEKVATRNLLCNACFQIRIKQPVEKMFAGFPTHRQPPGIVGT